MELKLAKSTLSQANAKNKVNVAKISYEDMLKKCAQGEHIFYFDKENSHKEMQKVCASFQKAGYNTYLMVLMKQVISMNFILSKIIESIHLRQ